jgi:hypothetical protein
VTVRPSRELKSPWSRPQSVLSSPLPSLKMSSEDFANATDGTRVISEDPWLRPFAHVLRQRYVVHSADVSVESHSLGRYLLLIIRSVC